MRSAVTVRPCVVCGDATRDEELRLEGDWRILRCERCGLRTLDPEPGDEQLVEVFDDGTIYDGAFALREDIMARHALTLADLERRVKPGRLLDVGCGLGFFLEAARARGWHGTGVDPSPFSVEHIRSLGFVGHQGLLHEAELEKGSYDAVSLLQVVEHLLDPRELLAGCMQLLRPGGVLLVATPNPRSLLAATQRERFNYWIPPVHCVWYTPPALEAMLANAGYRRVRVSTWSARGRSQHDGVSAIQAGTIGKILPVRVHRAAGDVLSGIADSLRWGSIVEATAVKAR